MKLLKETITKLIINNDGNPNSYNKNIKYIDFEWNLLKINLFNIEKYHIYKEIFNKETLNENNNNKDDFKIYEQVNKIFGKELIISWRKWNKIYNTSKYKPPPINKPPYFNSVARLLMDAARTDI